jgi:DNA-binding PadR family transcriptional regulator
MEYQRLTIREELILLAILSLHPEAYAYAIQKQIKEHTGDAFSLGTIHTILYKLEKRGILRSVLGGSTKKRGGRSKRLFELTNYGTKILEVAQLYRGRMLAQIKMNKWSFG